MLPEEKLYFIIYDYFVGKYGEEFTALSQKEQNLLIVDKFNEVRKQESDRRR